MRPLIQISSSLSLFFCVLEACHFETSCLSAVQTSASFLSRKFTFDLFIITTQCFPVAPAMFSERRLCFVFLQHDRTRKYQAWEQEDLFNKTMCAFKTIDKGNLLGIQWEYGTLVVISSIELVYNMNWSTAHYSLLLSRVTWLSNRYVYISCFRVMVVL